jgi:hypothetical protein
MRSPRITLFRFAKLHYGRASLLAGFACVCFNVGLLVLPVYICFVCFLLLEKAQRDYGIKLKGSFSIGGSSA